MMKRVALAAIMLVGCAEEPVAETETPSFAEDPYAFCMAKDERWLLGILERVGQSLPPDFVPGSITIEYMRPYQVDVGPRYSAEGRLVEGELQITLRLSAERDGVGKVQLPTFGRINPESCRVDQLEANVGYDRYAAETERFPIQ